MGYDVIVAGVGAVGSAAMLELTDRGLRVLGIDRFAPGHDRGSSHGQTRIIRTAYFEHPDYVPLLRRAWTGWDALEARTGRALLRRTGLVELGPADGEVVAGVLQAAAQHGLAVERLDAAEVERRWSVLRVPDGLVGVFEEQAGILSCEEAVLAQAEAAVAVGATLWTDTVVHGWSSNAGSVTVRTSAGDVEADALVVAAGGWAGPLLGAAVPPLEVRRKQLHWFADHDPGYDVGTGLPIFFHDLPDGQFYGFPAVDGRGVKVAEHTGGGTLSDASVVDRGIAPERAARVEAYVRACLPGVRGRVTAHAACIYTMSPDGHFVVGRHPVDQRVTFAAGLSGHGFKFAPVLGTLLADLAVDGHSQLPHAFLQAGRPAPAG